jgi:mannose-6-phosphate isomerase-like protein (cupin superfamily)
MPGTLLDVQVDRAQLPGKTGFFILGRNVAQPGARHTFFDPDEKGMIAIVVESGALTYEIAGPGGRIYRHANSTAPVTEPAPAGQPFTLAAGDALVYPAQKRVEANTSDKPVTFLFVVILEPVGPPAADPSDVGEQLTTELARRDGQWMALPDGPIALTLRRDTVGANADLAATVGSMQAVSQESGTPGDLLVGGDGAAVNLSSEPIDSLIFSIAPVGAAAASPAAPTDVLASPAGGEAMTTEAVATVSLLGAAMPQQPAVFDGWSGYYDPGDSAEYPSYAPAISIAADLVVDGQFAAQSAGRMQLQRHGTIEEVTPGTEAALGPGDAVVYVENSAAQKTRNPGKTPTDTISFGVFSVAPPATDYPGMVNKDDWSRSGLSGKDVAVVVERLTLPPGASLPAVTPDPAAPRFYAVQEGTAEWVLARSNGDTPTLHFYPGQMIRFRSLPPGETITLRNPGSEPLVLLQLSLAPAQSGAASTPVA